MCIYDGLSSNLQRFYGVVSIGTSLGGLYSFLNTPESYAYDLVALQHWGGISYFTLFTLAMLRYRQKMQYKVNRIYLLAGG
mmetsp:Transcript_17193/g.23196  ORF Transcript_17193/g.23196 Transcript_17193/m.23196 type:complete len:81 (+) Transcript_17193:162-404(+)